jgi:integrase
MVARNVADVTLSLLTGVRTEEARALQWSHVVAWVEGAEQWQPITAAGFDRQLVRRSDSRGPLDRHAQAETHYLISPNARVLCDQHEKRSVILSLGYSGSPRLRWHVCEPVRCPWTSLPFAPATNL